MKAGALMAGHWERSKHQERGGDSLRHKGFSKLHLRFSRIVGGPCVQAFTWNSGGSFAGKAWSEEVPTDSALLLYILAAFLAAPHWDFPKVGCGASL